MKTYYRNNIEKWKERQKTKEYKDKKNAMRRKRYAEDSEYRERIKSQVREYFRRNPDAKLKQHLSEKGITIKDYNEMLERQRYSCAICGKPADECKRYGKYVHRPLFIDHDHTTGQIRGLLCDNCNFILGHAKDNIHILENAIKYLNGDLNR